MDKIPAASCRPGEEYESPRGARLICIGPAGEPDDHEVISFQNEAGGTITFPPTTLLAPAPSADNSPLDHTNTTAAMLNGADRKLVEARIHELDVDQLTDLGTRDGRLWLQALIATELERRGFDQVQAKAEEADGDPQFVPHAFDGEMQTCDICHQGRAHPLHAKQTGLLPPQNESGIPPAMMGADDANTATQGQGYASAKGSTDTDKNAKPHAAEPAATTTTAIEPCRRCVECEGEDHHWIEDYGFATEEPEHYAAKAGLETWQNCKHCDAVRTGPPDQDRDEVAGELLAALEASPAAGARVDLVKGCSDLKLLTALGDDSANCVTPPLQATVMREVGRQIKALQKVHDGSQKDRQGWLKSKNMQARPGALALCRELLGDEAPADPPESEPAPTTTATDGDTDGDSDSTTTATPPDPEPLNAGEDDGSEPATKPDENKQPATGGYISPAEKELIEKLMPGLEVTITRSKVGPVALGIDGWMARAGLSKSVGYGIKPTDAIRALADKLELGVAQNYVANQAGEWEKTEHPPEESYDEGSGILHEAPVHPRCKCTIDPVVAPEEVSTEAPGELLIHIKREHQDEVAFWLATRCDTDGNPTGPSGLDVTPARAVAVLTGESLRSIPPIETEIVKIDEHGNPIADTDEPKRMTGDDKMDLLARVVRHLDWYRASGIDVQIGTRRGD